MLELQYQKAKVPAVGVFACFLFKGGGNMCSVVGLLSYPEDYEKFEDCFNKTKSRGPDDTRVIRAGDGLLGFHRQFYATQHFACGL